MKFELTNIVVKNVNNMDKGVLADPSAPSGDPTIFNVIVRNSDYYTDPSLYGITIKNVSIMVLKGGTGALLQASFERDSSSLNISQSSFNSI